MYLYQNRRRDGAGDGNRTRVISLEVWVSREMRAKSSTAGHWHILFQNPRLTSGFCLQNLCAFAL